MSTQVLPELHAGTHPRALSRSVPYLAASALVAAAWLLFHALSPQLKFPLDDPYIALHSAQVLHWGHDPNYPGVSALYGSTSAPFVALLYLLLFFLAPLRALETACWLGVLAYVLGLVHLTRALNLSRSTRLAVVLLGLTSSFVPIHLLNGLETCWVMAAVIWTLSLATEGRSTLAALAAGITAAIRPDLVVFAVPVFAALVYTQPHEERLGFVKRAAPLAALPIILCALWYLLQTGHLFPMTGIAKRFYIADAHSSLSEKIDTEIALMLVCIASWGPMLLAIRRVRRDPLVRASLLCIGLLLLAIYIQFPQGLSWNRFRYVVVLAPIFVWAVAIDAARRSSKRLLLSCLAYAFLITLPYGLWIYRHDCQYFDTSLKATADWCNHSLPPDARIVVQDAGYISYATPFRIIDFVGLKTPEAIAFNRQYTWPTAGRDRAKAVSALALEDHGNYLISLTQRSDIKELAEQLTDLGWQVQPLKSFPPYAIYRIQPPQAPR